MTKIEQLAKELYLTRKERAEAKLALYDYRAEFGSCPEVDAHTQGPCFQQRWTPVEEWCETCQGSEPLYQRRKSAGIKVASSLRKLMNACAKLP